LQRRRVSAFGLGIIFIVIVLLFSVGFESESNSGISLDELEQNQYSITPETIPLIVTTDTISPLAEKISTDTQSVTAEITKQNNYSGAGLVFPLLQQAFGIGSTVTTLEYNSWNVGSNTHSLIPRMDVSGGANNGMVYFGTWTEPAIYRLNPTNDELTKWTAPLGSYRTTGIAVSDNGFVYFQAADIGTSGDNYLGKLNPTTNDITLWDLDDGYMNVGMVYVDDTTAIDILWITNMQVGPVKFRSLNTDTDELKVWNADSLCTDFTGSTSSGFYAAGGTTEGLVYLTTQGSYAICTLDPATNQVKYYDTGLTAGSNHRGSVDSTGIYYMLDSGTAETIVSIDPDHPTNASPTAKVWTLTGQSRGYEIAVDLNDDAWFVSRSNAANSGDIGIVRLDVSTNIITEWDIPGILEFSGHMTFPNDGKNDMWATLENDGTNSNDLIVQYCEGTCT